MNKQRRHFTGTEKVAILKRHLVDKVPISDLCDELGLYPNLLYAWLKEFFENGHRAFENSRKAKAVDDVHKTKIQQLEAKLARKNEVMAELMEAHKVLGNSKGLLGSPRHARPGCRFRPLLGGQDRDRGRAVLALDWHRLQQVSRLEKAFRQSQRA
jgi:transposase-like protein